METQNLQNCRVTRSYKVEIPNRSMPDKNEGYRNFLKEFFMKFNKNLAICGAAAAAAIRN